MRITLAKYFLPRYVGHRADGQTIGHRRDAERFRSGSETARTPTPLAVDIRNLVYRVAERTVFDAVNIAVPRGQVIAIMGPSGVGKTTLLRLITGQLSADSGSVVVAGQDLQAIPRAKLYALRRRMGMLFQSSALLTDISVYENVAFPLRELTDLPERLIQQLVLLKLQAVGLRGACALMPNELSGGMARRVALARAIVMDPELLIYDEPFVGLDPISLAVILSLIRRLNDALGLTSIIVSHGVRHISTIADRIILLSRGKVIADGTPADVQSCSSAAVRQFMAGSAAGPDPFHYPGADYFSDLLGREVH
jgi:phospholipid/cholesterol/gamma-HCH transport system ATP-binding protein